MEAGPRKPRKQMKLTQEDIDKYLKCPKCGESVDGGRIRYVEKIEVWREVVGIKDGTLVVDGAYQSGEGYEDQEPGSEYLECHADLGPSNCLNTWKVPEYILALIEWE